MVFSAAVCAQPVEIAARWTAGFPAAAGGGASVSTAVPVGEGRTLVAVVGAGSNGAKPSLSIGNRSVACEVIGWDPVSRLCFLQPDDPAVMKVPEWLDQVGPMSEAALQAVSSDGLQGCRSRGWVKQVGGKVLPLALLKMTFTATPPPAGTPIVDSAGRVVAIVFQGDGTANGGFAIPAEAVMRVAKDIRRQGRLVRGWIGLSLRPESASPQVVRVLPDSPAAKAGIRAEDVVLGIGARPVTDYADAANAFFYLLPGEPVAIRLARGTRRLEFNITPVVHATP